MPLKVLFLVYTIIIYFDRSHNTKDKRNLLRQIRNPKLTVRGMDIVLCRGGNKVIDTDHTSRLSPSNIFQSRLQEMEEVGDTLKTDEVCARDCHLRSLNFAAGFSISPQLMSLHRGGEIIM